MNPIIHIALSEDGLVLAHFLNSEDCAAFCENGAKYTHLPFNTGNAQSEAPPAVGTTYRA